ncbi:MAG: signal peptidase I [Lachnospiraceae bacterium]|nr:signal peptidase I [Lachnospiraceae bacterium]
MSEEKQIPSGEEKKPEGKKPLGRIILENVLYFGAVIIAALLFVRFIAVRSIVEGSSMSPFVEDKNNLIVQKVSYYFHDPKRFDVIVFELKDQPNIHYIKRVIGLPGETVQIIDGLVYINGEKLEGDTYCSEPIRNPYMAEHPITLQENEFFVMGDNRNNSKDSRAVDVGPVKRSQIIGKALFRFWPLTQMKYVGR